MAEAIDLAIIYSVGAFLCLAIVLLNIVPAMFTRVYFTVGALTCVLLAMGAITFEIIGTRPQLKKS